MRFGPGRADHDRHHASAIGADRGSVDTGVDRFDPGHDERTGDDASADDVHLRADDIRTDD